MKTKCENVESLTNLDGSITIRIGSKIRILEITGYTKDKLEYPYEGIVTGLVEEWDNGDRHYLHEDWGPNMISIGENTFYPGSDFKKIELIEF